MTKLRAAQTVILAITALGFSQSAVGQDVCEDFGKPVELTFGYIPGTDVITNQDDASATGTPDDDGDSFIVVTDRNSVSDVLAGLGDVYFSDTVLFEEVFTASAANAGADKFRSNTFIYVFEDLSAFAAGSDPLQTMRYHTSCSQPIQLGDVIGSVTLVGYVGEDAEAGIEIPIDIKPGSDPNSIDPFSRGVIPVAILTTEAFDALTVDADSVLFGPAEAENVHKRAHVEDVDDDGDLDLLLHFRTQDTGIAPGDIEACLIGQTYDGVPIMGCDSVRTVPPS